MNWDEEDAADRTRVVDEKFEPESPATAEERQHCLVMLEGLEPGRRIVLGAALTFGRVAPSDVVLADTDISRAHCRVEVRAHEVVISDLGSTNGTYIDGKRIHGATPIANGGTLRIGGQAFRHELRNRSELAASAEMERDMGLARSYIEALLPVRLTTGAVHADWLFEPSARIGGDALGYHALDDNHFAMYLMDVAGHGAGAALHAATLINVMRNQALPGVDMRQPDQVLRGLNVMFQMQNHGQMFFTAWYGVYCKNERELRYCAGGHHPGYLATAGRREMAPLATKNPMLGVQPAHEFRAASTAVAPGARLYLFSDGMFEIEGADGVERGLEDFLPALLAPASGATSEPQRLLAEVKRISGRSVFDDDLTVLVLTFP